MQPSIDFTALPGRAKYGFVTWGAPWPRGEVRPGAGYTLTTQEGTAEMQSRELAFWPDGSVKWSIHTAAMPAAPVTVSAMAENKTLTGIAVQKTDACILVDTGAISVCVPAAGPSVLLDAKTAGRVFATSGELLLTIEKREQQDGEEIRRYESYTGETRSAAIEVEGPLQTVVRVEGVHVNAKTGRELLPFILRLTFHKNSAEIGIVHSFVYDADEERDFVKSIGLRLHTPLAGKAYNRHIRLANEHGYFKETAQMVRCWIPRTNETYIGPQINGELLSEDDLIRKMEDDIPVWNDYRLVQRDHAGYEIQKGTGKPGKAWIHCLTGNRARGTVSVGGEDGGVVLSYREFWQRSPSGLQVDGLATDDTSVTVWFWPPDTEAMDMRHYTDRGYNQSYYEGFDNFGATPYGIAVTSRLSLAPTEKCALTDEELDSFTEYTQKPPLLVAAPAYYHSVHAFGRWSLPQTHTASGKWVEGQLDAMFAFHKQEVEQRGWYGIFDYGDVMHTYDPSRHTWRYDMGGYAWQNTELVPTYWLWYAFMRSGREDIFSMAEAMTLHCSEVDTYHTGPYKGLGSRHNVRHWGCPCKEPRIAMAGHNRFYAYLTGDLRTLEIMNEVADADYSTLNIDPLREFYDKEEMVLPTHARTGPDWAAYCTNWLVQWELNPNTPYLEKILRGVDCIAKAPLRLISGSDYEYNPETGELRYIGEKTAGGSHLSLCMGSAEAWMELVELLPHEDWAGMVAEYGRFYFLPKEEQQRLSNGLVGDREFSLPFMAADIGLYGADAYNEPELAQDIWRILIEALTRSAPEGFTVYDVPNAANQECLKEVPWISTNEIAQWCLKAIVGMEFSLPEEKLLP